MQDKITKRLSNKFKWWLKPAIKQKGKRGGASSGQILGIKIEKCNNWTVTQWNYGFHAVNSEFNLISVYNNVGFSKIIKDLRSEIFEANRNGKKTFIIGDLNARVSE